MKFLHKYGTRPNEIRRARREFYVKVGLALAALLFFVVMILFARFQPGIHSRAIPPADADLSESSEPGGNSAEKLRQLAESAFLEYQSGLQENPEGLGNIDLLEKAIELQSEVIRSRQAAIASARDIERLREFREIRDGVMGDFLMAQSLQLEEQAESAWESSRGELAMAEMEKAINLQSRINNQFPNSSSRNPTRLHQLSRKLLLWQTEPIAKEADTLRKRAFELAGEGAYSEARTVIRKAVLLQRQLMQEYRDSSYSNLNRMRQFEAAQVEIDTAQDRAEMAAAIADAEADLAGGDWRSALAAAEQAQALARALPANYNAPDKQQDQVFDQILALKETAASWPASLRARAAREQSRTALARMNMDLFQEKVSEWWRESESLFQRFPRSRLLNDFNREEVELLYGLRREVPSILEMVDGDLQSVPNQPGLQMYTTEVTQALYESVTGENPSVEKDYLHPVDSVTWKEADDFTRKLGIILGRPVGLPSREAYLSALGVPSRTAVKERCWSAENSGRQIQQVGKLEANDHGFKDLLGNVAEWLKAPTSGPVDKVIAIGGSARDSISRLESLPEESRGPEERNRFVGFRFVIDAPEESKH